MVVLIVAIACAAGAADSYFKAQRQRNEVADRDAIEDELDELRERIEVLEKIVTDDRARLEREIEQL